MPKSKSTSHKTKASTKKKDCQHKKRGHHHGKLASTSKSLKTTSGKRGQQTLKAPKAPKAPRKNPFADIQKSLANSKEKAGIWWGRFSRKLVFRLKKLWWKIRQIDFLHIFCTILHILLFVLLIYGLVKGFEYFLDKFDGQADSLNDEIAVIKAEVEQIEKDKIAEFNAKQLEAASSLDYFTRDVTAYTFDATVTSGKTSADKQSVVKTTADAQTYVTTSPIVSGKPFYVKIHKVTGTNGFSIGVSPTASAASDLKAIASSFSYRRTSDGTAEKCKGSTCASYGDMMLDQDTIECKVDSAAGTISYRTMRRGVWHDHEIAHTDASLKGSSLMYAVSLYDADNSCSIVGEPRAYFTAST